MKDVIFEHMAAQFPFLARDTEEYYIDNYGELIVRLNNGDLVSYDDTYKTFRKLPSDYNLSEDDCKIEFGIRLRKIMSIKGVTQVELCEATGIQQSLMSNYITGRTNPSFYNVDKIAKFLGCSVDEFRYYEADNT